MFFSGAKPRGGYFLFHIPLVLEKKLELVQVGAFQKHVGVVAVRELLRGVDELTARPSIIRAMDGIGRVV